MTSSLSVTNQNDDQIQVKESSTITTIHRIYNDENIILRDPNNRRSFINRSAYAKLHRSYSTGSKRHSVDNLKGRFENLARQNSSQSDDKNQDELPLKKDEPKSQSTDTSTEEETRFTPASFGYPKTAKLVPPLIKPKPAIRKKPVIPKDENSNVVNRKSESSDAEEVRIVVQHSASEESVDKIAKELSNFTMDGKPKERKRTGSFRKLFLGGLFGKDKKKKEEERRQKNGDNIVYNDNLRNESNFTRQSSQRQTVPNHNSYNDKIVQEVHEEKVKELEQKYAELHVNRFHKIRQNFDEDKDQGYVPMDNNKKKSITDYMNTPVDKYIDTSSSASTESEKPNGVVARDTPPRAQETYQNIRVVKPKSAIPLSVQNAQNAQTEKTSPRTIERNLNKSNSKDYPDKPTFSEDTYGTVFDSLEYAASRNGNIKPLNSRPPISSPKPLSLESTKLKLPPNREIYEPLPRVKSPIPTNRVSTEKIIATELLKNTARSPTPPKRVSSKPSEEMVTDKPPMSPKSPRKQEQPQSDKIVTNALVHHSPMQSQTPVDNSFRVSTPVDLRMSVSMKMSPQKQDIRKSVEEYYWKELKKLKEEEDSKLYSLQMSGYFDEQARVRRSRSLSPSTHRGGRRSLSLPRDGRPVYADSPRLPPPQSIPEDQAVTTNGRQFTYEPSFVRNNAERRSVDSLQRPIFRRGSLTKQEMYESQNYNKRVSFNSQAQQAWPTRNGYTQSPPQRRLERMDSELEDEVFVSSPREPIYGYRYNQNEPVYSNRVLEQFRAQQFENMRRQQLHGQQMGARRLSMDSIPRQDMYVSRNQMVRRPVSNVPPREMIDDYGRSLQQYHSNSQLSLQRNPVYSSRQSMTDAYNQKQVTVRNKYCDFYGQIHDAPQTGVVMGQLQNSPLVTPHQPESFIRGSRLTSSANDIGKRYVDQRYNYEPTYGRKYSPNYDNRPLPPPPSKSVRNTQISDTESGSDASEIQRIMQTKNKSKKRSFFGK